MSTPFFYIPAGLFSQEISGYRHVPAISVIIFSLLLPYKKAGEFLERFCAYFGLVETKPRGEDPHARRFFFKASGFLDKLLTWKI